jgi:hypothetical protein
VFVMTSGFSKASLFKIRSHGFISINGATQMLPNKGFNMPMPPSQLNGGRKLDDGCGEIAQSEVPAAMDCYKSTIPEAEATKIINGRKS